VRYCITYTAAFDMQKLKPTDFGGHGRASGICGGLWDREFISFCPPDVQPRTRVIGVCGVNDFKDAASPQQDGWFISDFYLFHYLLQDSSKWL
jgi:hypothetical protein